MIQSQLQPLCSIVVVTKDDQRLFDTLNSLQSIPSWFEVIIQNGGNAIFITPTLSSSLSNLRVINQQDRGIYDAMNQAVKYCSGKYLWFLNCGDLLSISDFESFRLTLINSSSAAISFRYLESPSGRLRSGMRIINKFWLPFGPVCHQSILLARSTFNHLGPYNTTYRYISDRKYISLLLEAGYPIAYSKQIILLWPTSGFCTSNIEHYLQEFIQYSKNDYGPLHSILSKLIILLSRILHLL